jgi:hypothetical protein
VAVASRVAVLAASNSKVGNKVASRAASVANRAASKVAAETIRPS